MARRRPSEEDVSLFPFLDILACLIGCLTLMITALVLEMDNPDVAQAEEAERVYKDLESETAALEALKEKLAAVEARGDTAQAQLAALRAELQAQQQKVAAAIEANQKPPTLEMPQLDPAEHQKQLAAARAEAQRVEAEIKKLEAKLAEKQQAPEEPQVQIQPSGSGVNLKPVFVECHKAGLTLFESATSRHPVAASAIRTDPKYLALLKRVAGDSKSSVIFLVRSDALNTYNVASQVAKEHYARNGKLPVVGQGKIDVSAFEK